ncbi:MAG: hypothetical protein D6798_05515, partial [Deltaproteobacteria bacterium]
MTPPPPPAVRAIDPSLPVPKQEQTDFERLLRPEHIFDVLVTSRSEACFAVGGPDCMPEGGVYLPSMSAPAIDEKVAVRVRVEDPHCPPMTLPGRVAWLRTVGQGEVIGFGVAFELLTPNVRSLLDQMIARVDREPLTRSAVR